MADEVRYERYDDRWLRDILQDIRDTQKEQRADLKAHMAEDILAHEAGKQALLRLTEVLDRRRWLLNGLRAALKWIAAMIGAGGLVAAAKGAYIWATHGG